MYRIREYEGQWEDNERNGKGIVTYVNGDKIEGNFVRGHPHGVCQYHFSGTCGREPRMRFAEYVNGTRTRWLDQAIQLAKDKIARTLVWMEHEEEIARVLRENPDC